MTEIIRAENLQKYYRDFPALKGISFCIRQGESVGFLGHNGAGKTTTMRMLYGLSKIEHGQLWLFGEAVKQLASPAVKQRMGIVPQEDNLDTDLSVIENLEIYGGYFGMTRQQARQRGEELLDFMGLADKVNDKVDMLSGGSKRKLVIARALLNQPQLLILDEPTTGLDPKARRLVWQKLRQLKDEGTTLLLTTHYMEEAAQLCDRLLILHAGELLAQGSPAELIKRHVLADVIEVRLPEEKFPVNFVTAVEALGGQVLQQEEGTFIFTNDGKRLWEAIETTGIPQSSCYLRPAHLEDVFLKLTGRGEEQ